MEPTQAAAGLTYPWPGPSSSCVQVLLAAGAAVDAPTADGQTPLFLACEAGRLDCVRVLLAAGADRSRTTEVRQGSFLVALQNCQ